MQLRKITALSAIILAGAMGSTAAAEAAPSYPKYCWTGAWDENGTGTISYSAVCIVDGKAVIGCCFSTRAGAHNAIERYRDFWRDGQ